MKKSNTAPSQSLPLTMKRVRRNVRTDVNTGTFTYCLFSVLGRSPTKNG